MGSVRLTSEGRIEQCSALSAVALRLKLSVSMELALGLETAMEDLAPAPHACKAPSAKSANYDACNNNKRRRNLK